MMSCLSIYNFAMTVFIFSDGTVQLQRSNLLDKYCIVGAVISILKRYLRPTTKMHPLIFKRVHCIKIIVFSQFRLPTRKVRFIGLFYYPNAEFFQGEIVDVFKKKRQGTEFELTIWGLHHFLRGIRSCFKSSMNECRKNNIQTFDTDFIGYS